MKRRIGIDSIFDKDKNDHYTRKALLYQNILQYAVAVRDDGTRVSGSSFKHWDLSEWLMSKNNEFVNYYKDLSTKNITISNRIDNTQTRTKDKLNDLINLDLIETSGYTKQEKVPARSVFIVILTMDTCLHGLLKVLMQRNRILPIQKSMTCLILFLT